MDSALKNSSAATANDPREPASVERSLLRIYMSGFAPSAASCALQDPLPDDPPVYFQPTLPTLWIPAKIKENANAYQHLPLDSVPEKPRAPELESVRLPHLSGTWTPAGFAVAVKLWSLLSVASSSS